MSFLLFKLSTHHAEHLTTHVQCSSSLHLYQHGDSLA